MGMTAAERQRAYRARRQEDAERLNMVVGVSTKRQLERLARHHGVTQRALLERLLADAEGAVVAGLKDHARYYDGVTALRRNARLGRGAG
jgi:hypothetical protein